MRSTFACQILQYLPGEDFIDFAVSRYGLRLAASRIVINVVPASMTEQNAARLLEP